ncbi:MAG TPA: hypothetical protein VIJ17_05925, partial [Pseudolabrys sp.]
SQHGHCETVAIDARRAIAKDAEQNAIRRVERSAPFPRSEACRTKGTAMRAITKPPPSSHCDQCGGELRLKQIETADRGLDLEYEILVCASCGREQSITTSHDHQMPHTKVA